MGWNIISSWDFQFITRQWATLETWLFQLVTKQWSVIDSWFFLLDTGGWHTVASWFFLLESGGVFVSPLPLVVVAVLLAGCVVYIFGVKRKREGLRSSGVGFGA
jgi:hypothetical protein